MVQINELVTQNLEKVRQYFDSITTIPSNCDSEKVIEMPKDLKSRSIACIYEAMVNNRDTLEALLWKKNDALGSRLEAFLDNPGDDVELVTRKATQIAVTGSTRTPRKDTAFPAK